ncbi:MAG TPA: C25 family cysteine peptidase, partial [Rhodothermales bacterium]|nr:C25 family cysteine peptidase [Rhodothermales bacterium]
MRTPRRASNGWPCLLTGFFLMLAPFSARAQHPFDPAWYRGPAVKIGVVEDGVYRVTGAELAAAGLDLTGSLAERLELVENGRVVPLLRLGSSGSTLLPSDTLVFVGRRNRGTDEALWAYDTPASQSSPHFSLFSDTTYYWLRFGTGSGARYRPLPPLLSQPAPLTSVRDTVHMEAHGQYYDGDSDQSGHPLYTRGEGHYTYGIFQVTATRSAQTHTLSLPGHVAGSDSVFIAARLSSGSGLRHDVRLSTNTTGGYVQTDAADWSGYAFRTLWGRLPDGLLPQSGQVSVRLDFNNDFGANPNVVFLDYLQAIYRRHLAARGGQDRLPLPAGPLDATLTGYGAAHRVLALSPETGLGAVLPTSTGSASLRTQLPTSTVFWTAAPEALRTPVRLRLVDVAPLHASTGADYVIVTTPALRSSAEALAAYHRATRGFTVAVVMQQDVFDQFDYGRPTPLALRRFVQASRAWSRPARYLMLWGDALIADRTRPLQPWEVVTFGSGPSDSWFAMGTGGPSDLTESLATGRIPIRTQADGTRFVQKLQGYETGVPAPWQRRALHVSGGLNPGERATLRSYHANWAALEVPPPTAIDTVNFFKQSGEAVDAVYRDRITAEVETGAAWYAYFGHSAPEVWEVQTTPPQTWRNADRLPLVLSMGCRTGNFTLGSATENTLALSEALVVPALGGGIAHWGSSELSSIVASGAIATEAHRL